MAGQRSRCGLRAARPESGVDIIRHGLDEAGTFELEAALRDVLSQVTNLASGHGAYPRGTAYLAGVRCLGQGARPPCRVRHRRPHPDHLLASRDVVSATQGLSGVRVVDGLHRRAAGLGPHSEPELVETSALDR